MRRRRETSGTRRCLSDDDGADADFSGAGLQAALGLARPGPSKILPADFNPWSRAQVPISAKVRCQARRRRDGADEASCRQAEAKSSGGGGRIS